MSSSSAQPDISPSLDFTSLETYPWSTDPDFQSGLAAILGTTAPDDTAQTQDLTLRARCFYYARMHSLAQPIDFDAYRAWRAAQPPHALSGLEPAPTAYPASSTESTPVKPARAEGAQANGGQGQTASGEGHAEEDAERPSFQDIIQLIQSGKPIPGIKDIPDTVLVGQGTEPAKVRRQKPWEMAELQEAQGSSLSAEFRKAEAA